MAAHAKLSPSGSAKWMTCSGSVALEATLPPQEGSSVYAARGTACHALSEICLNEGIEPDEHIGAVLEGVEIDEELIGYARTYINYVRGLPGTKFYENRVSMAHIIPECFGTVDCIILNEGNLQIVDLKSGAGVKVDAENNSQLLLYALGAYGKFDALYDFETVTCTIVQPPLNHIDSWTVTKAELSVFADKVIEAYENIVTKPDVFTISEKGCRWCRAKAICPAMQENARKAASADFKQMRLEEVAEWLTKVPMLKDFIEAVESMVKDELLQGGKVPGYKVVEGRSTRAWKDETKVIEYLHNVGVPEDAMMSKPELLSVAQLEKSLKAAEKAGKVDLMGVDLIAFVEKKTGNPTIAPESDKRPALAMGSRAAKDFEGVV